VSNQPNEIKVKIADEFVLDFILALPQNLALYEAQHGVVTATPDPGQGGIGFTN